MRMVRVIEFLSLDGVMQSPAAPDGDTEGGFRHDGWQSPYFDQVLGAAAGEGMAATDAYLFGRKTYEHMAAHWPSVSDEDPFARHLNSTPKYVASNTLRDPAWRGTTVIEGDVAEEVRQLKQERGGNIAVLGSGELVQTLIHHDLIDEYFLVVFPIVLGSGKRLFRDADQASRLRLVTPRPPAPAG